MLCTAQHCDHIYNRVTHLIERAVTVADGVNTSAAQPLTILTAN